MAVDDVRAQWFAVWTNSRCEQLVHNQLTAKGFNALLPTMRIWSRRAGKQHLIPVPMFPGYLFIRQAMDKSSYIEVLKTKGIVRILGERWDRLTPIADREIEALQRIDGADLPVMAHPYVHEGQRVRITHGSLAGVEGILLRSRPSRGLLVLSVDLLQRSVAVEVDCTSAVPIGAGFPAALPASSRIHAA